MDEYLVERLDRTKHHRDDFSCGKQPLDRFLRALVSQYEKRNLGSTYVLLQAGNDRILGYYTLASGSVPYNVLPAKAAKKLPKHPIPVTLLARLALDESVKGRGLGRQLLFNALRRVFDISQSMGIYAV